MDCLLGNVEADETRHAVYIVDLRADGVVVGDRVSKARRPVAVGVEIVADGSYDDPPRSDIIDAALTHLIQSKENVEDTHGDVGPETTQQLANTDILALHHWTSVDSRWQ